MSSLERDLMHGVRQGDEDVAPREGVQARIAELIQPLLAERDLLLASREAAKAQVEALSTDILAAERVLKAAGYEDPKPAKRTNSRLPKTLSNEVEAAVLAVVEAAKPVTGHDVGETLSISHKSASRRLGIGRDLGLLREAGHRQNATGRDSILYAAYPDTIERIEAAPR